MVEERQHPDELEDIGRLLLPGQKLIQQIVQQVDDGIQGQGEFQHLLRVVGNEAQSDLRADGFPSRSPALRQALRGTEQHPPQLFPRDVGDPQLSEDTVNRAEVLLNGGEVHLFERLDVVRVFHRCLLSLRLLTRPIPGTFSPSRGRQQVLEVVDLLPNQCPNPLLDVDQRPVRGKRLAPLPVMLEQKPTFRDGRGITPAPSRTAR